MSPHRGRRQFLKFLGAGFTGAYAGGLGPLATTLAAAEPLLPFDPIAPSSRDRLVLPQGFQYDVVAKWGDRLPGTNTRFGYNADFTAFIPLQSADEGLLVVNHEYVSRPEPGEIGVYAQTFPSVIGRAPRLDDEMHDVGVSVLHVTRTQNGRWDLARSPLTRRYDAQSRMAVSGPALQAGGSIAGTLANCSGCHTPWNTVLTCEENFQDFVPEAVDTTGRGRSGGRFGGNSAHFGWVVEIDPQDPSWTPVKHTMLGRFRHENVAVRVLDDAPVVAYMGDDRINGHVYRFVSERRYAPGRLENRGSMFSRGRLYAAVFNRDGSGEWRELAPGTSIRPNPRSSMPAVPRGATTLGQVYASAGAIVTDAFRASNLIGATPTGQRTSRYIHSTKAFTSPLPLQRPHPIICFRTPTAKSGASSRTATAPARDLPGYDGRQASPTTRVSPDARLPRRTTWRSIAAATSGSSRISRAHASTPTSGTRHFRTTACSMCPRPAPTPGLHDSSPQRRVKQSWPDRHGRLSERLSSSPFSIQEKPMAFERRRFPLPKGATGRTKSLEILHSPVSCQSDVHSQQEFTIS